MNVSTDEQIVKEEKKFVDILWIYEQKVVEISELLW